MVIGEVSPRSYHPLRRWLLPNIAGVAMRNRNVDVGRLGGKKRKSEKCESNDFFHGVVILFPAVSATVSVVRGYAGPDRYRVFNPNNFRNRNKSTRSTISPMGPIDKKGGLGIRRNCHIRFPFLKKTLDKLGISTAQSKLKAGENPSGMRSESGESAYMRSGPSPTARRLPKQNKRRNGHHITGCGASLAHLYFFIELTHPRAGVTLRCRRVNLVRPGRQKGESKERENNEFFHDLSYPFSAFLTVFSVVPDCMKSH
jgi:hypothetical protein